MSNRSPLLSAEALSQIKPDSKFQLNELEYALQCLLGAGKDRDWVTDFETEFKNFVGGKFAVAFNSGTSGLHAAMSAIGIQDGDEVIIPALSVIMVAHCVQALGGTPIFADVDIKTHILTLDEIKKHVSKRTKAIVVIAWDGICCDMDPIMEFARQRGIYVVNDCARVMDIEYHGRKLGSLADVSVFSFESRKHLTTADEGGVLVTDNEDIATCARKFGGIGYKHLHANAGETHLAKENVQNPEYKRFDSFGINYRLTDVCAAVGLGQLERVQEITGRRKKIGQMYQEALGGYGWFLPQATPPYCDHSYYSFVVDYRGEEEFGVSWRDFYFNFKQRGGDGFYATVMVPYLEENFEGKTIGNQQFSEGLCPIAEGLQRRSMCFKTNYRDLTVVKEQIAILAEMLCELEANGSFQ